MSLLVRIADPQDQAAWEEFVCLYQPVIYRTARYLGLQDADALDVTQHVLVSTGRSLSKRPHDPSRAKFRTWLTTVTRNAAINALKAKTRHGGSGDSAVQRQLNQIETAVNEETILEREYEKELFRVAARRIETEFEPATWQAFWQTTVEQKPIAEVAQTLAKNTGSIYAARSRVMRRLREEIESLGE